MLTLATSPLSRALPTIITQPADDIDGFARQLDAAIDRLAPVHTAVHCCIRWSSRCLSAVAVRVKRRRRRLERRRRRIRLDTDRRRHRAACREANAEIIKLRRTYNQEKLDDPHAQLRDVHELQRS